MEREGIWKDNVKEILTALSAAEPGAETKTESKAEPEAKLKEGPEGERKVASEATLELDELKSAMTKLRCVQKTLHSDLRCKYESDNGFELTEKATLVLSS